MWSLFLEGLLLQASLIFALGSQNIFVLESGLKQQNPLAVSFVCFLCDLFLISLGVAGAGAVFSAYSQVKIAIGIVSVIFLVIYGVSKICLNNETFYCQKNTLIEYGIKRSVLLAITFSIFNPHAYLDAFVLIGGYSTKYSVLFDRLTLGLGAACFSLLWFLFLSSASTLMKPIFSNAKSLKIISACSGLILLFLSYRLGSDVIKWIDEGPHSQILVKAVSYPLHSALTYSTIIY